MNGGMIGIAGAGAFGTALAVALAQAGREVVLWARSGAQVGAMADSRRHASLGDVALPEGISVTSDMADLAVLDTVLLAMPAQSLRAFLGEHGAQIGQARLVACCKGVDLTTLVGPTETILAACPDAIPAVLTGPSFAADIARGLPTALTLGCQMPEAAALQGLLSTPTLRLYRTDDVIGAELGGALKNVVAIAAGLVIGAGLGDSARAALMTRGFAEMVRLATVLGARAETLAGLSGLGDLVLTCTSPQSRNYRFGVALGQGLAFDPTVTVEGVTTAQAAAALARRHGLDQPVTQAVADITTGQSTLTQAISDLLSRPLKQE